MNFFIANYPEKCLEIFQVKQTTGILESLICKIFIIDQKHFQSVNYKVFSTERALAHIHFISLVWDTHYTDFDFHTNSLEERKRHRLGHPIVIEKISKRNFAHGTQEMSYFLIKSFIYFISLYKYVFMYFFY